MTFLCVCVCIPTPLPLPPPSTLCAPSTYGFARLGTYWDSFCVRNDTTAEISTYYLYVLPPVLLAISACSEWNLAVPRPNRSVNVTMNLLTLDGTRKLRGDACPAH